MRYYLTAGVQLNLTITVNMKHELCWGNWGLHSSVFIQPTVTFSQVDFPRFRCNKIRVSTGWWIASCNLRLAACFDADNKDTGEASGNESFYSSSIHFYAPVLGCRNVFTCHQLVCQRQNRTMMLRSTPTDSDQSPAPRSSPKRATFNSRCLRCKHSTEPKEQDASSR